MEEIMFSEPTLRPVSADRFFFLSRLKKLLELPDETLCFYLTLIKVWITEVRSYVVMCKSDWKQLNNLADSSFKYFSSCLYFWIFK